MGRLSVYSKVGIIIKKIFGISDISLFRKEVHKNIGKLFYHKKYNAEDIVREMRKMGMHAGSVVCIHCSMKEFYNFRGKADDLINLILAEIGEEGTLMMPAFVKICLTEDKNYVFDVKNDVTGAGFLAETFRKMPGVERSVNIHNSACAIGKYADYLVQDHHKSHDGWDENSPWFRMTELKGLVFNLGMPNSYIGSFDHCVESILQHEHPYWRQFFQKEKEYKYYGNNGEMVSYVNYVSDDLDKRTHEKNVLKYFTEKEVQRSQLSNLKISCFYSHNALKKMIELGRKGITIYYVPSTEGYIFK